MTCLLDILQKKILNAIKYLKINEEIWDSVTKEGTHNNSYNGECTFFPSENQRDWNKFEASWYKKEKFDPKTLRSYDKVIVRDNNTESWCCNIFSHVRENYYSNYVCIDCGYVQCIPYNDETKHLVGTTDKAPEFYRYWEN